MARWVWPAAAGVVASATGVVINLATDGTGKPWTWLAVVVLTSLGVVVALRLQPESPEPTESPERAGQPERTEQPVPAAPPRTVHNKLSGTVHGTVIQAGHIGSVVDNSVHQTAVAHENSTIHQAGRDIRGE